jgi:Tfp pilus assembly protein PilF
LVTKSILILLVALALLAGCTTPKPVFETDQYHQPDSSKVQQKPLNSLQMQALKLMNQQQYDSAIEYLQRAVKIEPRNALNWHYLAQNYWHKKDFPRCRDMIQRAIAYSQFDADLQRANKILLEQCSP